MSSDIGSVSLIKSYSDDSLTDSLKGWSSPFTISQYEYNSPKTAVTETSEIPRTEYSGGNEKYQAMNAMNTITTSNLIVDDNLETIEEMLVSFRKQPNHAAKIITNILTGQISIGCDKQVKETCLSDANTQMTSQPSISWTEKSAKTWLPTNQTALSTTPGRGILERDYDLSEWSNGDPFKYSEGNQADHYDVEGKPSIQLKHRERVSRNGQCDILVKAHGCIDLALQAPTLATLILTGITTSREIRIRKLFVNGQKYVFV